MKEKRNRAVSLLFCLFLILSLLTAAAFAAGMIETERPAELTISYQDGDTHVNNAYFALFRVADVDAYARMSLTEEFEPYRFTVSGLSDLESLTQEKWLALASTLKGCVLQDDLAPLAEGETDENGILTFSGLEPGLYLVLGSRVTLIDFNTYTPVPFMVFLPGEDLSANTWNYNVTAIPKFEKDFDPPEFGGLHVSRKVLKIWDDEGYESLRPTEITVQLLRDGEVYDTVLLTRENNWRYAWDHLSSKHDWEVVELKEEGYAVTVTRTGITFMMTNKFIVPVTGDGLPVQKRITGSRPKTDSVFTFVLTAKDASFPMPEGSVGPEKTVTVTGAGSADFGKITFAKAGTYVYTVREKNGGVTGYTYDVTAYTVTYVVTEEDGELTVTRTVTDGEGTPANVLEFTNPYTPPGLPQTGMLWWPVPVLFCAGLVFIMIGVIRRRRYGK